MAVPRVPVENKDEETRAYVSEVLADSGFRTGVANDAQTDLEKCESQHLLLVESDLWDTDGVEFFDEHNAVTPAWMRFWSRLFAATKDKPPSLPGCGKYFPSH